MISVKMKRPLSILLVVCIIVSMITVNAYAVNHHFDDAKDYWAEEAIRILADKDVIAGYPDGLVHPDEIITRGEFTALIARIMELEETNEDEDIIHFTDLNNHWSEQYVDKLITAGVIQNDDFGRKLMPDKPITRIEMIRMLVRAIGKGEHDESCPCITGFSDDEELSKGDRAGICTGKKYGIVEGYPDGTVKPHGKATRAEAFEMLVKAYKAKERIEKEEPSVIANTGDESPGSNNGGSSPAPQFSFTLPETAYTVDEIEIKPESRYVRSVTWSALKNGLPAELTELIGGDLDAEGGKIKFIQSGSITLIATAKNSRGVTVINEQVISIYPVITADFTLPKTAHTDTAVAVELSTENLGVNIVGWSLQKEGTAADMDNALIGELNSTGGTVLFKEKGIYTLVATITDELGKTITAQRSITIYPVSEVKLTLPAVSHTDKIITLQTETKETDETVMTVKDNYSPDTLSTLLSRARLYLKKGQLSETDDCLRKMCSLSVATAKREYMQMGRSRDITDILAGLCDGFRTYENRGHLKTRLDLLESDITLLRNFDRDVNASEKEELAKHYEQIAAHCLKGAILTEKHRQKIEQSQRMKLSI